MNRYQAPAVTMPCCDAQPARIYQHRREDAAQRVERWEDQRKNKTTLDIDPIRLLVGSVEGLEDALFLAEILGNRDAADCFLDGRIDIRHGLHTALSDAARHGTESQRNQENERYEGKHQQCHAPLGAHQDHAQNNGLEHLRRNVSNDHYQLTKIVGIGGDARNDTPG